MKFTPVKAALLAIVMVGALQCAQLNRWWHSDGGDALVMLAEGVVAVSDEGIPPDDRLIAITDEITDQVEAGVQYPPYIIQMVEEVKASGLVKAPLPPLAVNAAKTVLAVDAEVKAQALAAAGEGEERGWLDIGIDWLLLALQMWGGVGAAGALASDRGRKLIGATLSAINPTGGPGFEPGRALNAALALAGARHSDGIVDQPKPGKTTSRK